MPEPTPLSHGQLYSWREVDSYPPGWKAEANLSTTLDLRGLPADRVTVALRRLVAAYEPLRTTYSHDGDRLVQYVAEPDDGPAEGPGERPAPVAHVDRPITDHGDPDRTMAEVAALPFPMTGEVCWRGLLVTTGGEPMFLALSFSHLILDVWSVIRLGEQFRVLAADPDATLDVGPSQRELARRQHDDAAAAQQRMAEKHWLKQLTAGQRPELPTLATGVTRPRIQATLRSRRLGGLATRAAREHGVTAPSVVLAFVAAGLAEQTGTDRVTISLMSSNRFAPELRQVVGTLNQLVPVNVPVDRGQSLVEHVRATHWAGARAYRHGSYDVDRIAALAAEAGHVGAHDSWFNELFPCWYNHLQFDDVEADPGDDTPAEVVWTPVARQYGQPFDVRVTVRDGETAVALRTDPDVIDHDGLVAILRAVALGVQRVGTDPQSSLKDLWGSGIPATALFPAEVPSP